MLEVLGQDYVRTARMKGLANWIVIWKHAFRNASIPVVTIVTLQFGRFLAGAVVTETVFAVPGMGRLMVGAITLRDIPTVTGAILVFAIGLLVSILVSDILIAMLNPRIRYS